MRGVIGRKESGEQKERGSRKKKVAGNEEKERRKNERGKKEKCGECGMRGED